MTNTFTFLISTPVLILNLYVTFLAFRRNDFEAIQKLFQIILVWLLPLIGAIFLWAFYRNEDKPLSAAKLKDQAPESSVEASSD